MCAAELAAGKAVVDWASPCIAPEDALKLHRHGLWLLPLTPRSKLPYFALLPGGKWGPLDEQRATERDLLSWFDHDPGLNLGVICGHGSVVVDIDEPDLVPDDLELPPTWTVITGGDDGSERHRHLYYSWDGPAKTQKAPWGEIKADGSYVVAAGSTHPDTGRQYRWAAGRAPGDLPRAALPSGLRGLLQPPPSKPLRAKNRTRNVVDLVLVLSRGDGPAVELRAKTAAARRLEALAADEGVALRVLRAMGVEVDRLKQMFKCPLPGHEEAKPSAELWQKPGGLIMMHDWHQKDGEEWIPLPDLWAAHISGKYERLTKGQRAAWWIRCLADIGVIEVNVPRVKVPANAPAVARKVLDGFLYLLEIRKHYNPDQVRAAPFTWGFATSWCGIKSKSHVSLGVAWLLEHGWLSIQERGTQHGDKGKRQATVFELGPAALAVLEPVTVTAPSLRLVRPAPAKGGDGDGPVADMPSLRCPAAADMPAVCLDG